MLTTKNVSAAAVLSDKLRLSDDTADLSRRWNTAEPFKHIVLDSLFTNEFLYGVCLEIPKVEDETWVAEHDDNIRQFNHRSPVSLGPAASDLVNILHSAAFLYFLSEITGIWELLPDPYLQGASFHIVPRGGHFDVHADRNVAYGTGLVRRLGLMLYLNKGWKTEYGGQFELWNETGSQHVKSVEPIFNRVLLFEITETSFHGLPTPVACPEGQTRNSFAVFYHTALRAEDSKLKTHTSIYAPSFYRHKKFSMRELAKDLTPPLVLRTAKKLLHRSS